MFNGYVESDTGEILRMIDENGTYRGKAALAFLVMVTNYLLYTDDKYDILYDVVAWFDKMSTSSSQMLKHIDNCYYSGEWGDFRSGESQFFIQRTGVDVSNWEFEQSLNSINKKWTPLDSILESINWILEQFRTQNLNPMDWYSPKETTLEFEIIRENLLILKKRHAKAARIKFIM